MISFGVIVNPTKDVDDNESDDNDNFKLYLQHTLEGLFLVHHRSLVWLRSNALSKLIKVLFDKKKSEEMERYMSERNGKEMRNVPSLVDLYLQRLQTTIDNVIYLGDVGETYSQFFERILPHCDIDQLKFIEDSTEGRDINPMMNYMWKIFYQKKFGEKSFNIVVHITKSRNITFKWKESYEIIFFFVYFTI